MKRGLLTVLVALLIVPALVFGGGQKEEAEKELRAGLVVSGSINDGGWNASAYAGLKMLEENLGFKINVTENSTQDAHASNLRQYARMGYDLVIGHGFEFGDALIQVAQEFPDVYFAQVGGEVGGTHPNLTSGKFPGGEPGFVVGRLASELTKTNKVGFVGAMEIATIVEEVKFIEAALATYKPEASFKVAYTGSWTDVAAAKEAAKAMIASGVDVLVSIGDAGDVGAVQACQEAATDIWFIGWSGDRYELGPDVVATSVVENIPVFVELFGERFLAGGEGIAAYYGIADGALSLGTFGNGFPADLKAFTEAEWKKFETGEYTKEIVMEMIGLK